MSQLWPTDEQVHAASGDTDSMSDNNNTHANSDENKKATIFIRNLAFSVTDAQLASHFEDIGPIKHAFVARNKHSDVSRGFGFVEFATAADAHTAAARFNGQVRNHPDTNKMIYLSICVL